MIVEKKEHGTAKSYNYGCRCDLCKKAKRDYRKNGEITGHGTKWYYAKGCRCDSCREAQNVYKRKLLGRQPRIATTNIVDGTRVCYTCKETKPLEEFTKNSNKRVSMNRSNECKVCQRARGKNTRQTSPVQRFSAYKYNAKTRKIDFNLSYDEFVSFWNKPCHYCGEKITGIGLDRKDSSIGYSIDNIVTCCSSCNYAKGTKTTDQFIAMCKKIANKFKNHNVCVLN